MVPPRVPPRLASQPSPGLCCSSHCRKWLPAAGVARATEALAAANAAPLAICRLHCSPAVRPHQPLRHLHSRLLLSASAASCVRVLPCGRAEGPTGCRVARLPSVEFVPGRLPKLALARSSDVPLFGTREGGSHEVSA
eukprot:37504-Chlamydomonas_euryale.AAC.8